MTAHLPKQNEACRHSVAAFLLLAVSCSRPASMESFVKSDGRDAYGRYPFELQMDDSSSVHDISVMADMVCDKETFSSFEGFPLRDVPRSLGRAIRGNRDGSAVQRFPAISISGARFMLLTAAALCRRNMGRGVCLWACLIPWWLYTGWAGIGIRIDRKKKKLRQR